jgi:hypothetical protein
VFLFRLSPSGFCFADFLQGSVRLSLSGLVSPQGSGSGTESVSQIFFRLGTGSVRFAARGLGRGLCSYAASRLTYFPAPLKICPSVGYLTDGRDSPCSKLLRTRTFIPDARLASADGDPRDATRPIFCCGRHSCRLLDLPSTRTADRMPCRRRWTCRPRALLCHQAEPGKESGGRLAERPALPPATDQGDPAVGRQDASAASAKVP